MVAGPRSSSGRYDSFGRVNFLGDSHALACLGIVAVEWEIGGVWWNGIDYFSGLVRGSGFRNSSCLT